MQPLEIALVSGWAGFMFAAVLFTVIHGGAWRQGVSEGYGYAKEPDRQEYAKAGDYLRQTQLWPELGEDDR